MDQLIANPALSFAQGFAGGQQVAGGRQQNNLATVYRTHGEGIYNGSPESLSALAAVNPLAAMKIKRDLELQRREDEEYQRGLKLQGRDDTRWMWEVEQYKNQVGAARAKAEAEEVKRGVMGASAAQTPEQWDAFMNSIGQTELVGQFQNKDLLLRQYMTIAQILEADAPPTPMSPEGKVEADRRAGLLPEANPDARPEMTESERRLYLFSNMQSQAAPTINRIEDEGFDPSNIRDRFANGFLGDNWFRTEDGQQYNALASAWSEAALRIATGAAATPQEHTRIVGTYFAQAGDTPATIQTKRALRESYENILKTALSGGAMPPNPLDVVMDEKYGTQAPSGSPAPSQPETTPMLEINVGAVPSMSQADIQAIYENGNFSNLSTEARAALLARLRQLQGGN